MRVISSPQQIQKICLQLRQKGKIIAFVPTMGYLHEGHLTLLKKASKKADYVILSIFVNPLQFGKNEDLDKYPRDEKGDLKKAKECGVDIVFLPQNSSLYPEGYQTTVEVTKASQELCGKSRPGHFRGVTTIVAKLFLLIQPHFAFFGLKDYQQFAIISQMVKDLNFPIQVIGVPTIREKDGLALSSRNVYLSPQERQSALCLSEGLFQIREAVKNGETNVPNLLQLLKNKIMSQHPTRIDYIEALDAESIQPTKKYRKNKTLFAVAVFFGKTRLIDNIVV